jgi:hypothetical protein
VKTSKQRQKPRKQRRAYHLIRRSPATQIYFPIGKAADTTEKGTRSAVARRQYLHARAFPFQFKFYYHIQDFTRQGTSRVSSVRGNTSLNFGLHIFGFFVVLLPFKRSISFLPSLFFCSSLLPFREIYYRGAFGRAYTAPLLVRITSTQTKKRIAPW